MSRSRPQSAFRRRRAIERSDRDWRTEVREHPTTPGGRLVRARSANICACGRWIPSGASCWWDSVTKTLTCGPCFKIREMRQRLS